uniref:Btz domain-containing protein n=1 Tax=Echinostoma caproni TaxID=27848 RepID=A0A183AGR2_9TREM
LDKGSVDRGDLSKIVITRNRSGRIIRCKDDEDSFDSDRPKRDGSWKRPHDDDMQEGNKRGRVEPEDYRGTRRVFTPPRHAREGEHGSLTVYNNENDLPMTSKSLQERLQARIRAIERRHQLEEGSAPAVDDGTNGAVPVAEKSRESSFTGGVPEDYAVGDSPRGGYQGQWRGPGGGPVNYDRRPGGFHRPDYYGNRGGYFGRARGRGPRWRGQWDDYRGRRGNCFDDRRREGLSGASGDRSFDRRRKRHGQSGSAERSPRSSRSRSRSPPSRSPRSRSMSRSNRSSSASPSPIRPANRHRVISRARISTPPLAPLTNAKRSDSDENLAELDQFVAQLRAKRQMEQQMQQQQQYLAQMQENPPVYPGPQQYPPGLSQPADEDQPVDTHMSARDILSSPSNDNSNPSFDYSRSCNMKDHTDDDGVNQNSDSEPPVARSPEPTQDHSPYADDAEVKTVSQPVNSPQPPDSGAGEAVEIGAE